MQRLELDFRRRRAASPWVGRIVLAVALAFAADVAVSIHQGRETASRLKQEMTQAHPRTPAPQRKLSAEEIAAVRDTVERIGLPWGRLFRAVESAANGEVALTGLEPDTKTGTVLISGESKDYLAVLTYVLALGGDEALANVQLVRHEAKTDNPKAPVSFTISAAWSEARK
jgi:Tfp pilus assembly protein PilN